MSSFLQKLKVGSVVIDNTLPPDIAGVVTRRLEKAFVNQPVDALELILSDDAEVINVQQNSPSEKANIPLNFIIYDVNGEFVETREDFVKQAANSLNLIIKLQSTAAISEIIALILREEEYALENETNMEHSRINLDELSRSTPRYSFLSMEHPLFSRYMKRLEIKRDALNQIRQRTREAQEEQRRLMYEKIEAEKQKIIETEDFPSENEERKSSETESNTNEEEMSEEDKSSVIDEQHNNNDNNNDAKDKEVETNTFVTSENMEQVNHKSNEESQHTNEQEMMPLLRNQKEENDEAPPSSVNGIANHEQITLEKENILEENVKDEPEHDNNDNVEVPEVSTEELLALVGLPIEEKSLEKESEQFDKIFSDIINTRNDLESQEVTFITRPAEKYTLSTGEEVICCIKERHGPLPSPPPGRPPKIRKTEK